MPRNGCAFSFKLGETNNKVVYFSLPVYYQVCWCLSEPQGSVAATAEERKSAKRTQEGSGGLRDDLEGRGLHR
jgi:hypothetical protein